MDSEKANVGAAILALFLIAGISGLLRAAGPLEPVPDFTRGGKPFADDARWSLGQAITVAEAQSRKRLWEILVKPKFSSIMADAI